MSKRTPPPPKPRQRRDLTVEKLVEAALVVLQSHDPEALTMRRVAEQCGVSAMAIYHHVKDKDELARLAVDSLFLRACEATPADPDWRRQLIDLWLRIRRNLLETPGAGMIFMRRAIIGPGTAKVTEEMFRLLYKGKVRGSAIAEAADALTMLTIGSIANELTRPVQVRELLGRQLSEEDMPMMRLHLNKYATRDGTQRYQLALGWLFDGIVQRNRGKVRP